MTRVHPSLRLFCLISSCSNIDYNNTGGCFRCVCPEEKDRRTINTQSGSHSWAQSHLKPLFSLRTTLKHLLVVTQDDERGLKLRFESRHQTEVRALFMTLPDLLISLNDGSGEGSRRRRWGGGSGWVGGGSAGPSVDIRQVFVAPVEVSTSVEPSLGAGVWVGAHMEPPTRHPRINVCRRRLTNCDWW